MTPQHLKPILQRIAVEMLKSAGMEQEWAAGMPSGALSTAGVDGTWISMSAGPAQVSTPVQETKESLKKKGEPKSS